VQCVSYTRANGEAFGVADGTITTAKIAATAVTEAKLDSEAVIQTNMIGGLKLSNDTDTDHDVNITAGGARDAGDAVNMILSSEITKQIDAAWAVGDDAGGIDTGSVGNSTLYAVWLIRRSDTSVVDALFSASFTSPTMPTDYDQKRLIGAVKTDGSANIIAFTQSGNYFAYTGDVIADISDASTSSSFETDTLSVPPSCLAHIYIDSTGAAVTTIQVSVRTKDAADVSADPESTMQFQLTHDGGSDINVTGLSTSRSVLVNASSQIEYAGTNAGTIAISTYAFTMLTRTDP